MGISEVALESKGVKTGATYLICVHSEMPQTFSKRNKESSKSKFTTKQQGGGSAASESDHFNQFH